uniref:Uncharacterized protein n=1 Tax=Romanomermis culicivorax TaxID=13658 RepID=A0A915I8B9_ROMCU
MPSGFSSSSMQAYINKNDSGWDPDCPIGEAYDDQNICAIAQYRTATQDTMWQLELASKKAVFREHHNADKIFAIVDRDVQRFIASLYQPMKHASVDSFCQSADTPGRILTSSTYKTCKGQKRTRSQLTAKVKFPQIKSYSNLQKEGAEEALLQALTSQSLQLTGHDLIKYVKASFARRLSDNA